MFIDSKKSVRFLSIFQVCLLILTSFSMSFMLSDSFTSAQATVPVGTTTLSGNSVDPDLIKIKSGTTGKIQVSATKELPISDIKEIKRNADGGVDIIAKDNTADTLSKDQWATAEKKLGSNIITQDAPGTYKGSFGVKGGAGHLVDGLLFATAVAGAIQLIGNLAGLDGGLTNSLTYSAIAGVMSFKILESLGGSAGTGGWATDFLPTELVSGGWWTFGAAFGIAAVVFIFTYEETETKTITFTCMPFEPPLGGSQCEQCNDDPFRPCSEYRCKSLGQACEIVNKDSPGNELCVWAGRNDTNSPTITPWVDALKPTDLKYIKETSVRPETLGVKIVSTSTNGCLKAFTPLQFGITLNKAAQCKIDYNHTTKYEDMQYYFGESNLYAYNHTQKLSLPAPASNSSSASPFLQNDGSMNLYIRCRDANGNYNVDEYAVSFCVDESPDATPPTIEKTSITSGSPVRANVDSVNLQVFVDEPAECKWSRQDKSYQDMENALNCNLGNYKFNSDFLFVCSANLTGVQNLQTNTYYFRCKDNPGKPDSERNEMHESYKLDLRGSQMLNIIDIAPANETVTASTTVVPVTLSLETSNGADQGKSICSFSATGVTDSFIEMDQTNGFSHKQPLNLVNGNYTYYFRCIDAGGNVATSSTNFEVFVDKQAPQVVRIYREGVDALKVVTDEDATCSYSVANCNFDIDKGVKLIYSGNDKRNMYAQWKPGFSYYIRCMDNFGNQPNANSCNIIASPVQINKAA